jgi:hypothetical protein
MDGSRRQAVRRAWWWSGGALLAGAAAVAGLLFASGQAALRQPIRFSHADHVKQAKCGACHLYATKLAAAGAPKLADCVDCHEGTQSKTPQGKKEEAKLDEYVKASREIPWVPITPSLAPHAFFSHRRHVTLEKIECATCHGKIAETSALPAKPAVSFTMDFCVSCHEKRKASVDCLACHK